MSEPTGAAHGVERGDESGEACREVPARWPHRGALVGGIRDRRLLRPIVHDGHAVPQQCEGERVACEDFVTPMSVQEPVAIVVVDEIT